MAVPKQLLDQVVFDVAAQNDRDPVFLVEVIAGRDLLRELLPQRSALLRIALQ
jgi:hypothetical protein